MDFHLSRGFNPLSGQEIKKAICGSLFAELDKHDYLSTNLAYPGVRWKITIELELASSSSHQQPEAHSVSVFTGYQQTDDKDMPIVGDLSTKPPITVEHEVEFPDLSREQFIDGQKPAEPETATRAVAPTAAGVEAYPEKFRRPIKAGR